ncbi:hypothetical protein LCGC14_1511730 [marine sediment metagenome]|uniref:Uncharacterized protein n=1 Tax=marine sediment metagenome TaxID=412755 RepID=A0A0F9M2C6_9ZZZZ
MCRGERQPGRSLVVGEGPKGLGCESQIRAREELIGGLFGDPECQPSFFGASRMVARSRRRRLPARRTPLRQCKPYARRDYGSSVKIEWGIV